MAQGRSRFEGTKWEIQINVERVHVQHVPGHATGRPPDGTSPEHVSQEPSLSDAQTTSNDSFQSEE